LQVSIATAHTVRVLDHEGTVVAKRTAWPTVESLAAVEAVTLAGCPEGSRLEVVIEPAKPASCAQSARAVGTGHSKRQLASPRGNTLTSEPSRAVPYRQAAAGKDQAGSSPRDNA
jgi:hypothetical protein